VLAGCIEFGIEPDGTPATIRLLTVRVMALQDGVADTLAARFASKH
jgi:hypothetical protein